MKLHHIGVACRNIEEEIVNISKIHDIVNTSAVVFDPAQNASVVLLTLSDGTKMELVSGEQVATFIKKNITYYHLCFEVNDLHLEIERLVKDGAILITPPKPALLFDNREVAFLRVTYGIIELLSSK